MKPSRELRDLVLGMYHDLSNGVTTVGLISASEAAVVIGTAPEEFWVGGQEIRAITRAQQEELRGLKITPGEIYAFEEGTVGWSCDRSTWELENGTILPVRTTVVFHREGSEWRIMHGHVSIAVHSSEAFGREFTTAIDAVASAIEQDRPDLAPVASPEGTLTIMFTDIEASTATNEALGDDAFLPLLIRHNQIVEGHTEAASGSVVKSQGDGYMLAFPSARRAVDCAISVQRDVCALDERIKVRMGLHTGEPRRHAEDFYGRDVAYAARLGAAAGGGQILVSSLVKSLVEPSGSVRFDGPRKLELKGFEGPQPVYEVLWR